MVESDSDYIMWFKLERSLFKTDEDIYFGAVYVPPADSRLKNADETDIFEIEIIKACVLHKYVFLMGDFNARVGSAQDYIDASDFLRDRLEIDLDLNNPFDVSPALMEKGLSKQRNSKDKIINNEGNKLLEICKTNNLIILNGRC